MDKMHHLLGILCATCKTMGQLVQASNKIQANSTEGFRDDNIVAAGQRKHHFNFFLKIFLNLHKEYKTFIATRTRFVPAEYFKHIFNIVVKLFCLEKLCLYVVAFQNLFQCRTRLMKMCYKLK